MKGMLNAGNSMALQRLEIHCVRLKNISRKHSSLRKKGFYKRKEGILEHNTFFLKKEFPIDYIRIYMKGMAGHGYSFN